MVSNRAAPSLDPVQYMNKNGSLNKDFNVDRCTFAWSKF